MPDNVLVDGFSAIKRPEEENLRRRHLTNRDNFIVKALADHFKDLNDSNLANQRHLSEIENLE
jgi:hypothetical protein